MQRRHACERLAGHVAEAVGESRLGEFRAPDVDADEPLVDQAAHEFDEQPGTAAGVPANCRSSDVGSRVRPRRRAARSLPHRAAASAIVSAPARSDAPRGPSARRRSADRNANIQTIGRWLSRCGRIRSAVAVPRSAHWASSMHTSTGTVRATSSSGASELTDQPSDQRMSPSATRPRSSTGTSPSNRAAMSGAIDSASSPASAAPLPTRKPAAFAATLASWSSRLFPNPRRPSTRTTEPLPACASRRRCTDGREFGRATPQRCAAASHAVRRRVHHRLARSHDPRLERRQRCSSLLYAALS